MPTAHIPVLAEEVIRLLNPQVCDIMIDGTLGGGGHAAALLERIQPSGQLYGFDQDPAAITLVQERFRKQFGSSQFIPITANAKTIATACATWSITGQVNGVLFDLGYSSDQFQRGRGFSFRALSDPFDLRMDPTLPTTAADLLNTDTSAMLVQMFRRYGELSNPHRLVRTIISRRLDRPIITVADVLACVQQAFHSQSSDLLAKIWQACRIAVNDELETLQSMLTAAFTVLSPGGRMAVITFHSLEDRIVKQQFINWSSTKCVCPPELPVCTCHPQPVATLLTKHPLVPSDTEIRTNPRSRSAKLRVIQKI
ncbi:MAG: 16S rRNA (cytosine(1402)-N(4))-methyltransferase RsmH [Patescibacteria group bacterium]